jgi:hypothetical protein
MNINSRDEEPETEIVKHLDPKSASFKELNKYLFPKAPKGVESVLGKNPEFRKFYSKCPCVLYTLQKIALLKGLRFALQNVPNFKRAYKIVSPSFEYSSK